MFYLSICVLSLYIFLLHIYYNNCNVKAATLSNRLYVLVLFLAYENHNAKAAILIINILVIGYQVMRRKIDE